MSAERPTAIYGEQPPRGRHIVSAGGRWWAVPARLPRVGTDWDRRKRLDGPPDAIWRRDDGEQLTRSIRSMFGIPEFIGDDQE